MIEVESMAMIETFGNPFRYYVSELGIYLGATDGEPLSEFEVKESPFSSDQIWQFPGWSESPSWAKMREDNWREEQMHRVANQLLMLEDEDPGAEPGTSRQWRDYRIDLRKWVDGGNPDFPNMDKRPKDPT